MCQCPLILVWRHVHVSLPSHILYEVKFKLDIWIPSNIFGTTHSCFSILWYFLDTTIIHVSVPFNICVIASSCFSSRDVSVMTFCFSAVWYLCNNIFMFHEVCLIFCVMVLPYFSTVWYLCGDIIMFENLTMCVWKRIHVSLPFL